MVFTKDTMFDKNRLFMLSSGIVITSDDYYDLDSGNRQEIVYYLTLESLKQLTTENEQLILKTSLKRITKTVFSLSGVKYKRIPADYKTICNIDCDIQMHCDKLGITMCNPDKHSKLGYIYKILNNYNHS